MDRPNDSKFILSLIFLMLPLLLLSVPGGAHAAVRLVPSQYSTIQGAVNASSSGDTILVAPGLYTGAVLVDSKSLTFESTSGASTTILDGRGVSPSIIKFSNCYPNPVVRGFTFKNGVGTIESGKKYGGAIYARLSVVRVEDSVFENNEAGLGGALGGYLGSFEVLNSRFLNNRATIGEGWGGGAIGIRAGPAAYIENSNFLSNSGTGAGIGGAIALNGLGTGVTRIVNSLFVNNSAYWGGAIIGRSSALRIENSTFFNNRGISIGGGVYSLYNNGSTAISNSIFWQNTQMGTEISDYLGSNDAPLPFINNSSFSAELLTVVNELGEVRSVFELGQGNLVGDPGFTDAGSGDFHLSNDSISVNMGDFQFYTGPPQDLDGQNRVFGAEIDLGCLENQEVPGDNELPSCASSDLNSDGLVGFEDLTVVLNSWGNCANPNDCPGDIDDNNLVGNSDLLQMLNYWGEC